MSDSVIQISPLGSRWQTADPFLFCVHHIDHYPKGNDRLGPAASLAGHDIGQDFEGKDGWRVYHGDIVAGFPQHPHRGFETPFGRAKGSWAAACDLTKSAPIQMGSIQIA